MRTWAARATGGELDGLRLQDRPAAEDRHVGPAAELRVHVRKRRQRRTQRLHRLRRIKLLQRHDIGAAALQPLVTGKGMSLAAGAVEAHEAKARTGRLHW
jgi:hypothetical protein